MITIKKKKKYILIVSSFFLLVFAAYSIYYIFDSMNYRESLQVHRKTIQNSDTATEEDNQKYDIGAKTNIINILFLGIDKTDERESWLGVYRSDTIALARIDLDNQKVKIMSIPRDTYTYVPIENKSDKINHAYAYGSIEGKGVQASIDAVNHLMGKNTVDYYFLMDMEPIPKIVDEIGGVKLDVEIDMKDHGANLSKGLQVLNGAQAFDYIHWRYSARGDIDRIQRQQKFIKTLYVQQRDAGKIMETLQMVIKYNKNVQMDLTMKQMIGLAKFLSNLPGGNITFDFIPGDDQMIDGISYWMPDESNTTQVLNRFFGQ